MKNKWNLFILIFAGAALLTGYVVTGTYGLGMKEKNLYKESLAMQSAANSIGFQNFSLEDYPVAFYDGTNEYVLTGDGGVEKRAPILGVLAATAYPVEDHMEIFVPSYKNLKSIAFLLVPDVSLSKEDTDIGDALMISTIWHEAFHAWQFTHYKENINNWSKEADFDHSRIDDNSEIRYLYEKQLELLQLAVFEENETEIKDLVKKICDLEAKRKEMVTEGIYGIEMKTELTEGSAQYVESQIFRSLCGETIYHEIYLNRINRYREGRDKYYTLGMVKCLLLDKLDPSWKNEFTLSKSLTEMLEQAID